jgi:hypothetical protein
MELNTTIMLAENEHEQEDVLKSVLAVNTPKENGVSSDNKTPILEIFTLKIQWYETSPLILWLTKRTLS